MPDFARMLDELMYGIIVLIAGIHWNLQEALIMAGYTVKLVNQWLIDHVFAPVIAQTNGSLGVAVGYVFIAAMLVLGITYMLASFIRLDVVSPRSALIWYVAGALFFSIGPSFYRSLNDFRLNIGQVMYVSVLNGMGANAGDFSSLAQVNSNDLGLGSLCDQFDVYLPGATGPGPIDGLDIAMAYLRGHAQDVMGYPQPVYSPGCGIYYQNPNPSTWAGAGGTSVVPMDWNFDGGYFDYNFAPITWDGVDGAARAAAVSMAGSSQQRALSAWPLLLFALVEQIVHLLITIAMGITFVSFGLAILFAFFKRTESIAHNMINQWIELIVQTAIIALIQALVIGFFLAGAATGSAAGIIGIGLICLVFIAITLWSGVKAVWNSFNRLFNAMGQATGRVFMTPGMVTSAAVTGTASAALGTASAAASVGSNALAGMSALHSGATAAQAAGLMLGGSSVLTGAARTLTHLPGLRNTALGSAAEQFSEGAATRRVADNLPVIGRIAGPLIGARLLSDRDPDHAVNDERGRMLARPMLVPAVGDALASWTVPGGSGGAKSTQSDEGSGEPAPRRTGTFTPAEPPREAVERQTYADDMRGEELETHLTERLGQLQVTGRDNIASVMGDVMRLLGGHGALGIDTLSVGLAIAQALGVKPTEDRPPVRDDLSRFGVFIDQAARLGLSPQQTERVAREINQTPDRRLTDESRSQLIQQMVNAGASRDEAEREVTRLEVTARLLPDTLTTHGLVTVPPQIDVTVNAPTPDGGTVYSVTTLSDTASESSGSAVGGDD
ncbi:MAG: hypothetical protein IPM16_15080 [Chloroflexi bacterium]|nr:hypothetical protein [Chloroflexota bacterium]